MTRTADEVRAAVEDRYLNSLETELLGAIALALADISESLHAMRQALEPEPKPRACHVDADRTEPLPAVTLLKQGAGRRTGDWAPPIGGHAGIKSLSTSPALLIRADEAPSDIQGLNDREGDPV